jgi:hypothetical protein
MYCVFRLKLCLCVLFRLWARACVLLPNKSVSTDESSLQETHNVPVEIIQLSRLFDLNNMAAVEAYKLGVQLK